MPLLFTSCVAVTADTLDVDEALDYCGAQVHRTLAQLERDSMDYSMMPRNIAATDTVSWRDSGKFISDFEVTPELMQGLIDLGVKEGVEYDEEGYNTSAEFLKTILKGLIGRDLFEQEMYYRIVNPLNPIFTNAVEIITDPAVYDSYLSKPQAK